MPETIMGGKFIDALLERKGVSWWIRFFSFLLIIGGWLYIFNAITTFLDSRKSFNAYNLEYGVRWLMQYSIVTTLIFGALAVAAGIGLLKIRPWGRKLAVGLCGVKILWAVAIFLIKLMYVLSKAADKALRLADVSVTLVVTVVCFSLMLFIFTRPAIKEEFV